MYNTETPKIRNLNDTSFFPEVDISIDKPLTVWAIYAVVLLLYLWLKERRTRRLVQALACIAAASVAATIQCFVV